MPWTKKNNPYDPPEPSAPKKPKVPPAILVEVDCLGCKGRHESNMINIRVEHKDNGRKRKACWKCNSLVEVYVDSGGGVQVFQTVGFSRTQTSFEKVWKEGDKL